MSVTVKKESMCTVKRRNANRHKNAMQPLNLMYDGSGNGDDTHFETALSTLSLSHSLILPIDLGAQSHLSLVLLQYSDDFP